MLDAGCGAARNSEYFIENNYDVTLIDHTVHPIIHETPELTARFSRADIHELPFKEGQFGFVICNAVLHFAMNQKSFDIMFNELWRVLATNGILFVRTCVKDGLESYNLKESQLQELPDGSLRYLTSLSILEDKLNEKQGRFIAPLKTALIYKQRSMATLCAQK
ncbi:MAG: class I SAM-dependent methyltransferase [Lentisphaeria bacterium]|nr:class I SAM-dependent methyltransferase [Lentisphaeria bacterium]